MKSQINRYVFGPLNVAVQGMGVYFGGKHLNDACDSLTPTELKQANREAWRQLRKANMTANRVSNVSIHGWAHHDSAVLHAMVAEAVCKATWKRINY